jgi:thiamine biosynthesis lipoprotein
MSNFSNEGDIAKINRSYQDPQKVGEDTIRIFNESMHYKKLTDGAFDVTVRGLMDLWSRCEKENRLPTQQELADAKAAVRLSNVKLLLGNRIEILNPRTQLDYGGIAGGFAVDEAVKMLHKKGIKNFLMDASGDMYASGLNCSRKPWTIAIRNPEDSSKIIDIIQVSGFAVSTSGGFKNSYSINGQKFSQLINPMTGNPQKDVLSATVIAPTAIDSDVLATSLCILDPKEGTALIDSVGKGHASIVIAKDRQGQMILNKSRAYRNFQIKRQ